MTRRRGFSLLELMIAIMILGIGTVMVATIFPVGLDMTRETIQIDIVQAVTDVAVSTLQIKVPGYRQLDQYLDGNAAGGAAARVLVPDIYTTDIPFSGSISPKQQEVGLLVGSVSPPEVGPVTAPALARGYRVHPCEWAPPGWQLDVNQDGTLDSVLTPSLQTLSDFLEQTRVYTEQTGWPGELAHSTEASVVPAQNLPSNFRTLANTWEILFPTMVLPVFKSAVTPDYPDVLLPRISLADQVYPPVVAYDATGTARKPADLAAEVATRRYGWLAFNHQIMTDPNQKKAFLLTVATTYRGDLGSRFVQQEDLDTSAAVYDVHFDLTDTNVSHQKKWMQPSPDTISTPSLFPVPWLVMFRAIDPNSGKAVCTAEVARLLPAGSYFIVAETVGPYQAGSSWKVLTSQCKREDLGKPAGYYSNYTLDPDRSEWSSVTIPPTGGGGGGEAKNVPVWVIPPAVEGTGNSMTFQARSPVVGVALRKVVAP